MFYTLCLANTIHTEHDHRVNYIYTPIRFNAWLNIKIIKLNKISMYIFVLISSLQVIYANLKLVYCIKDFNTVFFNFCYVSKSYMQRRNPNKTNWKLKPSRCRLWYYNMEQLEILIYGEMRILIYRTIS